MRPWNPPLYGTVCLINGVVFVLGTLALALSPARVSSRVLVSEAVVLAIGLAVILAANAALLRRSVAPVDRVIAQMETVELLRPGQRLDEDVAGPGGRLVRSFNAMLDRLEHEQGTSNARALAAQEAERHRIAQELHDEVGQSLTVVLLGLKQVRDRAPAELVDELELVRENARAGLDDVRRVARQLRPGVLDDLGLQSALAALATDFSAHGAGTVRRSFGPGLPPLSAEAELVVYRVAQEALTNAARHSGARSVGLALHRVGDAVVLEVEDDGRGYDGSTAGSGVLGMRERSLLAHGELSITGRPGQGTRVRLSVPVVTP